MTTTTHQNADALERDVNATRSRVNETLDALERKLSPGQLLDEGIDYFRHNGAGEFVSNLGQSARTNPMPVMLTSLGVSWLMVANRSGASAGADGAGLREARGRARDAADKTRSAARNAHERMQDAGDSTRAFGRQASDNARQAADSMRNILHEQPLVIGALGLAVGAALGASIPPTRTEDEMLGETRDAAVDSAKQAGRQGADKINEATRAPAQAASEQDGNQKETRV